MLLCSAAVHQMYGCGGRCPVLALTPALTKSMDAYGLKVNKCLLFYCSFLIISRTRKKNQTKENRVIHSWIFRSLSHAPTDLHTALTNPLWQQGKKEEEKKKGKDLTTWRTLVEKSLSWTPQSSVFFLCVWILAAAHRHLTLQRGLLWLFLEHLLMNKQSIKKVKKECDGMRAITRRTNRSSQTGWRSKRPWKKR